MMVGKDGDLRQVRDAEHLAVLRDTTDLPADDLRHAASHACVDLVESVHACRPEIGQHAFDGQHGAAELAAAGDAVEGTRLLAAVGSDQELGALEALCREPRAVDDDGPFLAAAGIVLDTLALDEFAADLRELDPHSSLTHAERL